MIPLSQRLKSAYIKEKAGGAEMGRNCKRRICLTCGRFCYCNKWWNKKLRIFQKSCSELYKTLNPGCRSGRCHRYEN